MVKVLILDRAVTGLSGTTLGSESPWLHICCFVSLEPRLSWFPSECTPGP